MKKITLSLLFIGILAFMFSVYNYKTDLSDLPYPSSFKNVNYTPCTFTISYSSNNPKSEKYGHYETKTLPLYQVDDLSEKECKCVEDALQLRAKNIQQFNYVDYPYFTVEEKNNTFDITVEAKDMIGTKMLSFNQIIVKNKHNLCKKWSY